MAKSQDERPGAGGACAYVIYYGWLTDDAQGEPNAVARAIAAAGTPLLIAHLRTAAPAGHRNLSPQVLALMRAAGVQVFGYVATAYGRADARVVADDVAKNLDAGLDGILFDEADSLVLPVKLAYYRRLGETVRSRDKSVILNTGVSRCGEHIMQIADRLMVEHEWRALHSDSPWARTYPPERFMGVSSNEERAMGYRVDKARAIADARLAWEAGVGWHTATTRYAEFPMWFDDYVRAGKTEADTMYSAAPPARESRDC